MGSTTWSVISFVSIALGLIGSILAIYLSVRTAGHALELQAALNGLKHLQAQSLEQRLSELEQALTMLANRVKMTRVRNVVTHMDRDKGGEPDAQSDPEAWRAWKNAQLRAGKFNA